MVCEGAPTHPSRKTFKTISTTNFSSRAVQEQICISKTEQDELNVVHLTQYVRGEKRPDRCRIEDKTKEKDSHCTQRTTITEYGHLALFPRCALPT